MNFKSDDKILDMEAYSKPEVKKLPNDLKIIKSARVKYKVRDVKRTMAIFKSLINNHQGYVSNLKFNNNLYEKENTFTVKIPAEHFDVILDSISKQVEFIDYEEVSTKDVSEEYVDLSKRLKTKMEVRERYEAILRKQAKTVEDILAVEEKLRQIQEEIESAQGRITYLNNKVAFSTIQISLYETVTYKEEPESYEKGLLSKIKEGFVYGWNMLEIIVVSIVYIWPFVLLLLVFILLRKKILKLIFRKY